LEVGTAVGVGMIDAHAGSVGVLGATLENKLVDEEELEHRIAVITGVSTCHLAIIGKKSECRESGVPIFLWQYLVCGCWKVDRAVQVP